MVMVNVNYNSNQSSYSDKAKKDGGRTGAVVSVADYGPMGPWFMGFACSRSLWPRVSHIYPLLNTGSRGRWRLRCA